MIQTVDQRGGQEAEGEGEREGWSWDPGNGPRREGVGSLSKRRGPD